MKGDDAASAPAGCSRKRSIVIGNRINAVSTAR